MRAALGRSRPFARPARMAVCHLRCAVYCGGAMSHGSSGRAKKARQHRREQPTNTYSRLSCKENADLEGRGGNVSAITHGDCVPFWRRAVGRRNIIEVPAVLEIGRPPTGPATRCVASSFWRTSTSPAEACDTRRPAAVDAWGLADWYYHFMRGKPLAPGGHRPRPPCRGAGLRKPLDLNEPRRSSRVRISPGQHRYLRACVRPEAGGRRSTTVARSAV